MSVTYPTTITGPEVHVAVQLYLRLLNEGRDVAIAKTEDGWLVASGSHSFTGTVLVDVLREFVECADCGGDV
jgi:hypothetical protein